MLHFAMPFSLILCACKKVLIQILWLSVSLPLRLCCLHLVVNVAGCCEPVTLVGAVSSYLQLLVILMVDGVLLNLPMICWLDACKN
jgi:hypothetical protein